MSRDPNSFCSICGQDYVPGGELERRDIRCGHHFCVRCLTSCVLGAAIYCNACGERDQPYILITVTIITMYDSVRHAVPIDTSYTWDELRDAISRKIHNPVRGLRIIGTGIKLPYGSAQITGITNGTRLMHSMTG